MISELLLAVFSKGPDGCLGGRAVEVFDLLGERAGYWDNVRTNFLLLRTRRTQFRSQCPLRLVLCFYNVCLCLVKKKKKKKNGFTSERWKSCRAKSIDICFGPSLVARCR